MENKCKAVREITYFCEYPDDSCKKFQSHGLDCLYHFGGECHNLAAQAEALAELEGDDE